MKSNSGPGLLFMIWTSAIVARIFALLSHRAATRSRPAGRANQHHQLRIRSGMNPLVKNEGGELAPTAQTKPASHKLVLERLGMATQAVAPTARQGSIASTDAGLSLQRRETLCGGGTSVPSAHGSKAVRASVPKQVRRRGRPSIPSDFRIACRSWSSCRCGSCAGLERDRTLLLRQQRAMQVCG